MVDHKDISKIRHSFPGLEQEIYGGKKLVYLDNAATTQRPSEVIKIFADHSLYSNANIHRGVHYLSRKATEAHEEARQYVADLIHADEAAEVLFTRGTTEGINLVAGTFCRTFMRPGDEVIVTEMEHHSNIVPWQMVEETYGIKVQACRVNDDGTLDMEHLRELIGERTKMIALCFSSNVLGTVNPVREVARMAHDRGIAVLVDAAQTIAHRAVDVRELDCDFLAFSGHKVYGPTGIGVLYGKRKWLEKLPPYQGGGEMISHVSFEGTSYGEIPYKYEAGTPDFIGSVALQRALQFVSEIGYDTIREQEENLLAYATEKLAAVPDLKIYGTAPDKEPVISFLIDGVHPYDLGTLLDRMGIAVRTGHHCAQPLMERFGIEGTLRASFAVYNTREEVDAFVDALNRLIPMLKK